MIGTPDWELNEIAYEARRAVDRYCGVDYIDPAERESMARRYEAALTEKAYLRAIHPYIDAKAKLTLMFLPKFYGVLQDDGSIKVVSSEANYPPETRAALEQLDGMINEIAARYLRRSPLAPPTDSVQTVNSE